jgi:hypothetical protein
MPIHEICLSMHARMAECLSTQIDGGGKGTKPILLPAATGDDAVRPVSGLSNWNIAVPTRRLPKPFGSVAFDELRFDYRCGGSAGIAI